MVSRQGLSLDSQHRSQGWRLAPQASCPPAYQDLPTKPILGLKPSCHRGCHCTGRSQRVARVSLHQLPNSTRKPKSAGVWGPQCSQLWPAQCLHPQRPCGKSVSGSPWAFPFSPACWAQLSAPATALSWVLAGKAQRLRPLYQYINYCNPELNQAGEGDREAEAVVQTELELAPEEAGVEQLQALPPMAGELGSGLILPHSNTFMPRPVLWFPWDGKLERSLGVCPI